MPKRLKLKNLLSSGSHVPNSEESQVPGSFCPPPIHHVPPSSALPQFHVHGSSVHRHIHVPGSSVPTRTQVPRYSAPPPTQVPRASSSFAPPLTQIHRASRSSAPPPIQIPRSSVPPLSPSSSSTSAGNHASVPPSTQPTIASKPTPSHLDPTFIKRSSSRYWTVNVLYPSGGFNRADLTLQKLIDLEEGFRVVVDFEGLSPFGLAAGLLGVVCGLMATDYGFFPISFKN
ncbi:hypothetical protein ACFE04_021099 [Oxalis oulophora]